MSSPHIVEIEEVVKEGEGLTTLRFSYGKDVSPGQFMMVWIPGIDEIPMSVCYIYGKKGITVKGVGEATRYLSSLRVGDKIGVRGPYGNGYKVPHGKVLIVGGGTGMASLMPIADLIGDPGKVDILIGARTASELLFVERARKVSQEVHLSTDDGTLGMKGTVVDMARKHLALKSYEGVLGCGPEKMLVALLRTCEEYKVKCQLSLERYMKCGSGLCGSCAIDGFRVCADGPVFDGETLKRLPEFGAYKRDECGLRVKL